MLNVFAWPGLAAGGAGSSLLNPAASSSPVNAPLFAPPQAVNHDWNPDSIWPRVRAPLPLASRAVNKAWAVRPPPACANNVAILLVSTTTAPAQIHFVPIDPIRPIQSTEIKSIAYVIFARRLLWSMEDERCGIWLATCVSDADGHELQKLFNSVTPTASDEIPFLGSRKLQILRAIR